MKKKKKVINVIILLSVFILSVSCMSENKYEIVDFSEISVQHSAGPKEAGSTIINDEKTWNEYWNSITRGTSEENDPAYVNFDKYSVIAINLGEKPTNGFEVEILEVKSNKEKIKARYVVREPGGNCITVNMLTYPVHIIKINKTDLPVIYIGEKVTKNC